MTTYKQSGVNIDAGNKLVGIIKRIAPSIGGFSGLFPVKGTRYRLAASTDGVGTKLKLAFLSGKHDTVGIDLVAMNVNDLVCCGAKPVFFLDYFACGKLDLGTAGAVIKGISSGCREAGCVLLGGETAEMPGFYKKGEYDLAGFAVGVVDGKNVIDGSGIKQGDILVGVPSSGVHSNGFSMVHKVFSGKELKKHIKTLLTPTRIYVRQALDVIRKVDVKGICHITGGGFYDNITRILPGGCGIVIRRKNSDGSPAWNVQEIFGIIQNKGRIEDREMHRVFNMGIGMVFIVREKDAGRILRLVGDSRVIGEVIRGRGAKVV